MWSGNYDILNGEGKAVKVYVPNHYHNRDPSDLTISTIGGPNTLAEKDSGNSHSQILHFHHEGQSWTLQAHNSFASFRTLFQEAKSPFSVNVGQGVVTCQKHIVDSSEPGPAATETPTINNNVSEDDDWDASGEDDAVNDMDDLESKLASIETSGRPKQLPSTKKQQKSKQHASQRGELPWFKLSEIREPPAPRPIIDQDDVGLSNDIGNDKIQQMLAKYMEEEQDVDLVDMLRGGKSSANGKAEPDERLSDEERALRTFVDRTNRLPRQVVRFAPTGVPLWSIPEPSSGLAIPKCTCGTDRVFQLQVVPQILHILQVDERAERQSSQQFADQPSKKSASWDPKSFCSGGMNFGNLAIYSCSLGTECPTKETDCVVVVQDSVDESPAESAVLDMDEDCHVDVVQGEGDQMKGGVPDEEGWVMDS